MILGDNTDFVVTAKILDLPLLTNNIKNFKDFKGVEVVDSIDKL